MKIPVLMRREKSGVEASLFSFFFSPLRSHDSVIVCLYQFYAFTEVVGWIIHFE